MHVLDRYLDPLGRHAKLRLVTMELHSMVGLSFWRQVSPGTLSEDAELSEAKTWDLSSRPHVRLPKEELAAEIRDLPKWKSALRGRRVSKRNNNGACRA